MIAKLFPDFQFNAYAQRAEALIRQFAERHHIWLANSPEYVTMTAYLHPKMVSLERLGMVGELDMLLSFMVAE